ncbi:MAG: repair protein [Acidimicrobiales bacterium]|nr:repair protein [Acidimicrobiales bacterium]
MTRRPAAAAGGSSPSRRGRGPDADVRADAPTRTLVVHCPDWPITAAGIPADQVAVVVRANRVLAASAAARDAGITTGLRRREAQRRCPHVEVIDHDPGRDARAFEPLAAALDVVTPRVEVTRPGTLAFATRGPSRYFGGDDPLAERTGWIATGAAGAGGAVRIGVADGVFAALLAAHRAARQAGASVDAVAGGSATAVVVPPSASPAFLAPHPVDTLVEVLDQPDLVDVWRRLGLRTLAQVADLPVTDVLARFGHVGVAAHRLASGLDPRPLDARRPAPDLAVTRELDPPADRVDRAAFVAKVLADELHARLAADGLACTHVLVQAETGHGETLARHWRHEGALTAGALADRVRWQLDGWLSGSSTVRPTAGISRLTLMPVEVVAARGRQLGFWGGETLVDERVLRAVARLQATSGQESVTVPELRGGRGPAERVSRVPVVAVDLTAPRPAARPGSIAEPWPGRVPAPAPAAVAVDPEPVQVFDEGGRPVGVTGRAEVTAPLASLTRAGRRQVGLTAWAGPWPVDEQWWDPTRHRRRARFQVLTTEGIAHLLSVESGRWWLEATYD